MFILKEKDASYEAESAIAQDNLKVQSAPAHIPQETGKFGKNGRRDDVRCQSSHGYVARNHRQFTQLLVRGVFYVMAKAKNLETFPSYEEELCVNLGVKHNYELNLDNRQRQILANYYCLYLQHCHTTNVIHEIKND